MTRSLLNSILCICLAGLSVSPLRVFALDLPATPGVFAHDLPTPPGTSVTYPPQSDTLRFASLAELSAYALATRPESRAVWRAMQADAALLDAAGADYWPTLTGQLNFTQNRALASSGTPVPTLNRYGPNLSLSYLLYDFGARSAGIATQRYQTLAAAFRANRQLQDLVAEVEAAYYALLGARAQQDAQTEQTAALQTSLDAVELRMKSGLATRGDTLRARAALAETTLALYAAERDFVKANAALRQAVGVDQTQALQLDWETSPPALDVAPTVLADLLVEAQQNRPDLAALAADAEAARAAADRAEAARWPTINFAANTGRTYFLEDDRVPSTTYSVGVNIALPLFDGGRLRAEARAANHDAARLTAETDVQRKQIALEIANAQADTRYAQNQRTGVAIQFDSAIESAKSAEARYRAGLGTLLELLTAQADLARARQTRAQADSDWLTAFSRLNQALGRWPAPAASTP